MEVETSFTNLFGWLYINRKRVLAGVIAAALIAAVASFYFVHKNQAAAEADQELLAQPIGLMATEAPDPNVLLKIDPSTPAGADAELLAAKELFLQSKFDAANQAFAKFIADNPGSPLVSRAEVGIAACLESAGKISDAVTQYKKVAAVYSSQADISYPVKLTLGRLSEAQGKPDVAVNYYDDLARINNPYDPWVAEAKERLRLLLAKHPELDKTSGVNPYQTTSPLTPSAADTQLSAPGTTPGAVPTSQPAAAPKTNQEESIFPPMNAPPPGVNPGGAAH